MSVVVRDLKKSHAGKPALAGVSFEVGKGVIAGVVGKSGAGKTTLLRCLVGLDSFDEGELCAGAVSVSAERSKRDDNPLAGRVCLVFQSFELFPHMRVIENLTLAPIHVRHEPRAEAEDRARALLDELGLADKALVYPDALSGGQKQRVAIARALAMDPEVICYDEPTSALDPSLKQEVGRLIRRVAERGLTQIVVTHDWSVLHDVAGKVIALDGGKVAAEGTPAEVLREAG